MIDTPADAPEGPNDGAPPVTPPTTDSGAFAPSSSSTADTSPAWAKRLRRQQLAMQGLRMAANSLRSADHGGGSVHINLEDRS